MTNTNTPTPIRSAARAMRRANLKPTIPSFFVVMIDYGRKGCEAIVDPEITGRDVVSRIVSGEYRDIRFIQEVKDGVATDVTLEMQIAASCAAMGRSIGGAFSDAYSLYKEWNAAIGEAIADSAREDEAADLVRAS